MDYSAMIQNRKSVRAFLDTKVPDTVLNEINQYYAKDCKKLIPSISTEIRIFGSELGEKLEKEAGYRDFMIGAPSFLLVLSDKAEYYLENVAYITEDLILKMVELGLDSCWITFNDGEKMKAALGLQSDKEVAAIIAFGYGKKTSKRIRLNITNNSIVDAEVLRGYYSPRAGIDELVFSEKWGDSSGVYSQIGDMDGILWRAFYAASLAPSYLNRQPYGFILDGNTVVLVSKQDEYTGENSQKLNLGIVMLHFAAVVSHMAGAVTWTMGTYDKDLGLPSGCSAVAYCKL